MRFRWSEHPTGLLFAVPFWNFDPGGTFYLYVRAGPAPPPKELAGRAGVQEALAPRARRGFL